MTTLSFRAAAEATVAETRRRNAELPASDAASGVHLRVIVDAVEAMLCGIGDLLDLGVPRSEISIVVADASAAALASAMLTMSRGQPPIAKALVAGTMAEVAARTLRRLDSPPEQVVYSDVVMRPKGNA